MTAQRTISVLWPAFLGACVLEALVFAVVDPHSLQWQGQSLELSRQSVYSLAFFGFWGVTALVASLALLVAKPTDRPASAD
ncbi:hypothetical protein [Rhodoferax ferrireducens]|nr:hypothetical protein [Rhodoferax ferrireducens]